MSRPALSKLALAFLWLYVFSVPCEKTLELPGLGGANKVFGAAALGSGMLAIVTRGRLRLPAVPHLGLALFILWSAATYCWTVSPERTGELINTYILLFAMGWMAWELCPGERQVQALLQAYVLGTAVPAWDTLHRFLAGKQTYYLRYASAGFDPNDLALTLALSLPMSYYLSLTRPGVLAWAYRIQMLAAMGTIFLTASRGGTMAMLVGLTIIVTTLGLLPAAQKRLLLVGGSAALAVIVSMVPAASWTRIASLGSEVTQGNLNSRTILWQGGWKAFQDVPLQGIGAGGYPEIMAWIVGRPWGFDAVAHNTFFSVLVETGIIGFLFFGAVILALLAAAHGMPFLPRSLWLTTLAVWAIGVSSLTWEYRKPTWLLFGLVTTHAAACTRRTEGEDLI